MFAVAGYSVHRWPTNRFDGMEDALHLLRRAGYNARVVVDCGANKGEWTLLARQVFPGAAFCLIEPQPACAEALTDLAARIPRVSVHRVAVTQPGISQVQMMSGDEEGGGTGAWVARPGEIGPGAVQCPATTLDAIVAARVTRSDRPLLKLDIEGHELSALAGAADLLEKTEVVLTEVQFYAINDNDRPVFADVLNFLRERGFELYDFACLSQRPRDKRLRMGDAIFARRDSTLLGDRSWE
jgi:FkbM family methyltransferase